MKKIKLLICILVSLLGLVLVSTPAFADPDNLSADQKKSCRNRWDGETLRTNARKEEFRDTPCATENYCSLSGNKVTCGASESSAAPGSVTPQGERTITGCGDIKTSLIKCDTTAGNPVQSLMLQVVNFLAVGVGIAVVGGIIWGGMLYASSNGDSARTKQGINVIVNAIIGLLLFIFMYAIINYLVPGGLFT
jgi:hypothetical protein